MGADDAPAATGLIEGYLHDYRGTAQELVSAIRRGFLYQGQIYPWQDKPRGRSTRGVARHRLIHFLENHDQVANVDAVLRVRGDTVSARRALDGLIAHLQENCIGYVSEVFDAEPPFTPGGCVAQAWGIAELLRCLLRTER